MSLARRGRGRGRGRGRLNDAGCGARGAVAGRGADWPRPALLPRQRPGPGPHHFPATSVFAALLPSFSTQRNLSGPHSTISTAARASMPKLRRSGSDW